MTKRQQNLILIGVCWVVLTGMLSGCEQIRIWMMGAKSVKQVASERLGNGLKMHRYDFENGLKLVVIPNHFAEVFTYRTMFYVGSKDEMTGKRGIAHLFEHMMFRETKHLKNGEFDLKVTELGGNHLNAYTSTDRTVYLQSLPSPFLEDIVKLEADRMENLVINKDRLEEERGAVLGEYNMYLNNPGRFFFKTMAEMLFEKHPYRYEVIGTEAEIKGFTVEDCVHFYETHYAPNHAVIVVVGYVEPDRAARLVERSYGHLKPREIDAVAIPEEPVQRRKQVEHIAHAYASQVEMGLAVKLLNVKEEEIPYFMILDNLLSNEPFSLAYQKLVQTGMATSVGSYFDLNPQGEPSSFMFNATLDDGQSPEKIQLLTEELFKELGERELSQEKIQMAVNQIKLAYFTESNESLADFVIGGLNYDRDPRSAFDFFYEVIMKATFEPKTLMELVRREFQPSRMNVLFMSPESPGGGKGKGVSAHASEGMKGF